VIGEAKHAADHVSSQAYRVARSDVDLLRDRDRNIDLHAEIPTGLSTFERASKTAPLEVAGEKVTAKEHALVRDQLELARPPGLVKPGLERTVEP